MPSAYHRNAIGGYLHHMGKGGGICCALALLAGAVGASAQTKEHGRVLLVPLDSRPAVGQFVQMIGGIADADVRMPAYQDLGRFVTPGNPESILNWIKSQSKEQIRSVILSADMIAYGGLICSRVPDVTAAQAIQRIRSAVSAARATGAKVYVSSATMRLAPTATKDAAPYRMTLARAMAMQEQAQRSGSKELMARFYRLIETVPPKEINRYQAARHRNHEVQRELVKLAAEKQIDYLVIGQDDAQPYGPHIPETNALRKQASDLSVSGKVFFCEGIDQHGNVLLSRALLKEIGWTPRVKIVYSDPKGADVYNDFESKPIRLCLEDQLIASGARAVDPKGVADYTLFVNTPNRRASTFKEFLHLLDQGLESGAPCAVADINLSKSGQADPELFSFIYARSRVTKLMAYAGWNTAGNTLGTSIPTANTFLFSKKQHVDAGIRVPAHLKFLLHRFVNDFAYHTYTRPEAYRMLVSEGGSKEESYGEPFERVNRFVQRDVGSYLMNYFRDGFMGNRFDRGGEPYEIVGLGEVKIFLPWPRAYEMRLDFQLKTQAVAVSASHRTK